jgi:serine/threonine-protein kinase
MIFGNGGLDPKPILEEWTTTAARAVKLDPRDVFAYDMLGYSHFMRALRHAREGTPSRTSWDEAISWLTRALELQPEYPWGHNDLGQVFLWRGTHEQEHAEDPREAYARAEHHLLQAARSDPDYLFAHMNLVDLYSTRAAYDLSRGRNPQEDVDKALQAGERALAIDGNHYLTLNNVAVAELKLARYLVNSGGDPRPRLERALHYLQRSAAINATFGRTLLHRVLAHLLEVDHAMREGLDPTAALEAGRRALAEAKRLDSGWVEAPLLSARLALAEAAWAKRRGRPELPFLQQALAEARRALAVYAYSDTHQQLAGALWRLAEAQPPDKARPSITEGLTQVDLALQRAPDSANAHALRGALLLSRARTVREAAERLDTVRQARASLARALEINPLLRREYEAPLREAESQLR